MVRRDEAIVGEEKAVGGEGDGRDEGVGGRRERGGERSVEGGERGSGVEERVDAVEAGFVEELIGGEAVEGRGGEAMGAEERKHGREEVGVAVDEVDAGGGERGEEGVRAGGVEGVGAGFEQSAADVQLDAVGG